jgi:hypothetical protein
MPAPSLKRFGSFLALPAVIAVFVFNGCSKKEEHRQACLQNMRQISSVIKSWSLEHKKKPGDVPLPSDITAFLKGNVIPTCPAGGKYSYHVGEDNYGRVTCTIPGHTL